MASAPAASVPDSSSSMTERAAARYSADESSSTTGRSPNPERSGIWRIPDANTNARNYYIIVEAVTPEGRVLKRTVVNEENGKRYEVDKWGLRVEEPVFERIAADKQDDGIIERDRFGSKPRGYLEPRYEFSTTGGAITRW